jgi:CubicO group peptidase (beta-lactamase class C family)
MAAFDRVDSVRRLKQAFVEFSAESKQGGAAVSLWQENQCLLSLHSGEASPGSPWTAETPCLIWSASKGVAAAVTLHALQGKGIGLGTPVADFWPEFAQNGKAAITLAELLSHRAGLAAIQQQGLLINDHERVAAVLASQAPNWTPDGSHGYGARTFGFLLDEIVRRISGMPLAGYWNQVFRESLELDLWFGLPEEKISTAALVIAPKSPPAPSDFSRAFGDPASLTRRALSEPGGFLTPSIMNTPEMRSTSIPSLGAIATADALARFYALLAAPSTFFTESTRALMQTTLSRGIDRTLLEETSFSAGFMSNATGVYGPNPLSHHGHTPSHHGHTPCAFGHPGAGGSVGFADPENKIGFAFIPSAMHPGALPGRRTQKLIRALYGLDHSE